jgi:hypothetical protein
MVVRVMVVMMMVMMVLRGERRGSKHHQQQGNGKNPFHGKNVAQERRQRKGISRPASREERTRRGTPAGVKTGVPSGGSWPLGWRNSVN